MRRLFLAFPLLLLSVATCGMEVAGVGLPPRMILEGQALLLNGAGVRRILLMEIYVAALYLPERRHSALAILEQDTPHRLQLTLLRDVSTHQNLDALKKGLIDNNGPEDLAAIQPAVERFLSYIQSLGEVPEGSTIQIDYFPGTTRVSLNGRVLGSVPGKAFNRALLRIWLGDDPVQSSLKEALLGTK